MASNETGVGKNGEILQIFLPINHNISETTEDRHIVTIEGSLIGSRMWVFDCYHFDDIK